MECAVDSALRKRDEVKQQEMARFINWKVADDSQSLKTK